MSRKQYPIHYAVRSGNLETVKTLISFLSAEDLKWRDSRRHSPLDIASIFGFYKIAEILISKGAPLIEKSGKRKNALIHAWKNGQIHIVSLLIRTGLHPDCQDSSGNTPLHYASAFGWLNIVEYLIENGADPNIKNDHDITPLFISSVKKWSGVMNYLLSLEGINKELVDSNGRSVRNKFF